MTELRVAPCSYPAARHAVLSWHYSHVMPSAKLVRYGAWEADRFIGAVLFGRGATPQLGAPYGLDQTQLCELVRVALRDHVTPVSQVVAAALRLLRAANPGLRLVVSFADSAQGHHGGIYQAGNWIYAGSSVAHRIRLHGLLVHPRTLGQRWGVGGQSIPWLRAHVDPAAERIIVPGKHRYLYPLDRAMRRQVAPLAQPYPARADEGSMVSHGVSDAEGQVRPLPSAPREATGG